MRRRDMIDQFNETGNGRRDMLEQHGASKGSSVFCCMTNEDLEAFRAVVGVRW
jgi:hypothetical protein